MRDLTTRVKEVTWPIVAAEALRVILLLGLLALGWFMLTTTGVLGWVPIGVACFEILRNGVGVPAGKTRTDKGEES
jgi:hypothetical protein